MYQKISPRTILKLIKFWPPFLGSQISVEKINSDFTEIVVKMRYNFLNKNYVGTHFGGSIYSMCDPFFMFILLHHLKKDHIIWDKSAKIDFKKPGKGLVKAVFKISIEEIEEIKKLCLENFSVNQSFNCNVVDSDGEIVAAMEKQLYIRRKDAKERFKKDSGD